MENQEPKLFRIRLRPPSSAVYDIRGGYLSCNETSAAVMSQWTRWPLAVIPMDVLLDAHEVQE
jgi:hypothetical protein